MTTKFEQNILTEFYKLRPELKSDANSVALIEQAGTPVTIESLSVAAAQLSDTLLLASPYQSAWDKFRALNPDRRGIAFRNQFIAQLREQFEKQEYERLIQQFGQGTLEQLREKATKVQLIEEICSLLRSKNDGRDGKYANFDLKAVAKQMQWWSIFQLQSRRDEIQREQAMVKQPISELKQIVKDARPPFEFPKLPRTIVPKGEIVARTLDAAYIKRLDSWEIRRLKRIYSEAAVDQRLREG